MCVVLCGVLCEINMNRFFFICIVIVDDYLVVVIGVCYELLVMNIVVVVVIVYNLMELMDVLLYYLCDVLVFDYVMFGIEYGDGFVMFMIFFKCFLGLKIVVMMMMENVVVLCVLIDIGIVCIVSKLDMFNYLMMVIYVVYMNGCYLLLLMDWILCNMGSIGGKVFVLLVCEVEVICFFVLGLLVNEIVDKFNCSKKMISM